MAGFTNAQEGYTLAWYFSNGSASNCYMFNPGSGCNVGLATLTVPESGDPTGKEVSFTNGYARVSLTPSTLWGSAASRSLTTQVSVSFPLSTGSWGTISDFLLSGGATGTCQFTAALSGSVAVPSGSRAKFKPGALTCSLATGLFTDTAANTVLEQTFRNNATSGDPSTLHFALSTTTPTSGGGSFTEPSSGGYARVSVTPDTTFWSAPTTGDPTTMTNANGQVLWPEATAGWGTVTYWGIFSLSTGGTLLAYGQLSPSQAVNSGDQVKFGFSDLVVTLD